MTYDYHGVNPLVHRFTPNAQSETFSWELSKELRGFFFQGRDPRVNDCWLQGA